MSHKTLEYRLASMTSRLKYVIRGADLQDDEFITVRLSITDREGVLLKGCNLSELEAEAKARQVLAGKLYGEKHSQELDSALNQPLKATSSAESLKRIPQSTQQAGLEL